MNAGVSGRPGLRQGAEWWHVTDCRTQPSAEDEDLAAEDGLHGPKSRCRIESAFEDKSRILALAGDDVLPGAGQTPGCISAEEVRERRLAESVEVFVCSE